jgi:DNA repair exonuclease SbcCD ATPase subunit
MSISNSDDIIDSRDVIKRIEELRDERDSLKSDVDEAREEYDNAKVTSERDGTDLLADGELGDALKEAEDALREWDESDEATELKALEALQEEAEGYAPDWQHGATLIRDSHFTEYTEELLKDIGDLPRDLPHYIAIDWEKTAENIQVDYTSVEFDGETYWVR